MRVRIVLFPPPPLHDTSPWLIFGERNPHRYFLPTSLFFGTPQSLCLEEKLYLKRIPPRPSWMHAGLLAYMHAEMSSQA